MKLVASAITRNEAARYLEPWLSHLEEFCDEIRVIDDASSDNSEEILKAHDVALLSLPTPTFDIHEGKARQSLLDWTFQGNPSHVLALDCDEFIGDGKALRALLEAEPEVPAWTLTMTEIWAVQPWRLRVRVDGAWKPYERIHLWAAPANPNVGSAWKIRDRKLACSPIPIAAHRTAPRRSGQTIYHFGWADPATRKERYDRYMRIDGGRHHARAHLQSIVWPEQKIGLQDLPWPDSSWRDDVRQGLVAA